jgi:hypothetical protein
VNGIKPLRVSLEAVVVRGKLEMILHHMIFRVCTIAHRTQQADLAESKLEITERLG